MTTLDFTELTPFLNGVDQAEWPHKCRDIAVRMRGELEAVGSPYWATNKDLYDFFIQKREISAIRRQDYYQFHELSSRTLGGMTDAVLRRNYALTKALMADKIGENTAFGTSLVLDRALMVAGRLDYDGESRQVIHLNGIFPHMLESDGEDLVKRVLNGREPSLLN